jgi:uncharacterized protein
MSTFVDTSVWFAAAVKGAPNNELAKSILLSIDLCVTTDLVLVEMWHLLKARFGSEIAEPFWQGLRESGTRIAPVTGADMDAAREIGARVPEEEFSLVDRTSLAVMERERITRAATFNPQFSNYRYGPRKQAFQIVRTGHSATFRALREAILQRRPVRLSYGASQQTVCPYILGHAAGEERAFAFLIDEKPGRKVSETGNWMCLRLAKVKDVEMVDGPWIDRIYPGVVQRCVDKVHLDARRLRPLA